jgi:hypothetical protein
LGFSRGGLPLRRRLRAHPLQAGRNRPSASGCHTTGLVPLLRFCTAPTGCSALRVAGLLHPAADPGVRRVSGRSSHSSRSGGGSDLPRRRISYPSEGCSSPTAAPCRHGRCPLAVTASRTAFADRWTAGFEALLHRRVRCARPPLPVAVARASPGLGFPSRYFPSTSFRFPRPSTHRPRTGRRTEDPAARRWFAFPAWGRSPRRSRRPTKRTENPIPEPCFYPPSPCQGRRTGALRPTRGRPQCRIQEEEGTDTTRFRSPVAR